MRKPLFVIATALLCVILLQASRAAAVLYSIDSPLKPGIGVSAVKIDGFIRYKKPDSPLIGVGQAWVDAGNKYSINSVYLLSHAILESAWGTSQIATDKKNIYGYGAYDRDPYGMAMSFPSFQACIDFVSGKINENYLTPGGAYYNGATLRGMNVKYATDPNWGSKIANIMNTFADPIGSYPPAAPPAGISGISSADPVALYHYGSGTTALWSFKSVGSGSGLMPYAAWRSGPEGLDPGMVKAVGGDFNGDGVKDIAGLYYYAPANSAFWIWKGKSDGSFADPVKGFTSSTWDWHRTKQVAGDFDEDGRDEILVMYDYGDANTGVWLFETDASGLIKYPRLVHFTTAWDSRRTKLFTVRDGAKEKLCAAYDYGNAVMGLWMLELNADGSMKSCSRAYAASEWDVARSTFLGGDVDGDARDEVIAAYNYGGTTTAVWVFDPSGSSLTGPRMHFLSDGCDYSRCKFSTRHSATGRTDLLAFYDYGGGRFATWVFRSAGGGLQAPYMAMSGAGWDGSRSGWIGW